MKFWDSSAIVNLLVEEEDTKELLEIFEKNPQIIVWWGTEIECVSAISRKERENSWDRTIVNRVLENLKELNKLWNEIAPHPLIKTTALRILRTHPLRAADSLQLAALIVASENFPSNLPFVCLDQRLADAANKEGFDILPS